MIMPENVEQNVWREARNLLCRWGELSAEIEALITEDEAGKIAPLLQERQQVADRLDALKERYEIASWAAEPAPGSQNAEMVAEHAEVGTILKRLVVDDERIRQAMESKLTALAHEIDEVRQTRAANRTYRRRRQAIAGAFIDTKR